MKIKQRLASQCAISFLLALVSIFLASSASADSVSDNAASWLRGQQITAGSTAGAFPWTPGGNATANTQGASALGLLRAWERSGNAADLAAAVANGDCQVNDCIPGSTYPDTHHRFATHDPLFLEQLSIDSGDPQYAAFVDSAFWSRLNASSYGEFANLDAADYANAVVSSRTGQGYPDLAAWDLSKTAIAAQLAGETVARDAMMQGILDSLNASDSAHTTFDVIGLTGAIWASAVTGVDLDPSSGKWAAANNTTDLAVMLLGYQAPSGGFVSSTTAPGGVIDANADTQTTAFAMQALDAVDAVGYAMQVQNGFAYISSLQQPSGEFLAYGAALPGSQGAVENQGEVLEAYASITQRPAAVYVDDGFAGSMPGAPKSFVHPQVNGGAAIPVVFGQDAFATIADALAQVQIGGTVYVAKGLYAEDFLAISRPVSIIGEQAGVDARTRSTVDADETIIVPGIAQPGLTLSSYEYPVIDIYSSDVALDGVIIDADNPALTSGLAYNGADPDVATGIFVQGDNTRFENSIFRNILYSGIDGSHVGNGASGGNIIRHNRFANITSPSAWGVAVILQDNFYAQVNDNLFNEVRIGVQTNNMLHAAPNAFLPSISGNEIHATRIGIFHNEFYSSASTFAINGNQFVAVANVGETGLWMGLWVETMLNAQTVTISGNTIDGLAVAGNRPSVGYMLNNITSTLSASTVISGGSVSHVGVGALATDATRWQGPVNDFVVRNVAFSDIGIAAFYVEDTTEQAGSAKLSIGDGNSYSNVAHVLALSGSTPAVGFTDTQTGVPSVFVRSARGYYSDPLGALYNVANAAINSAIGYAQVGGTVSVEAGLFAQNVLLSKGVALEGPFAGVAGFDITRNGANEAVIHPASGISLSVSAAGASANGLAFDGAQTNQTVVRSEGGDNFQFINNRITNVVGAAGILTRDQVAGWQIRHNLFENFLNDTSGPSVRYGQAVKFNQTAGGLIEDNTFRHVQSNAMQVEQNTARVEVLGNRVDGVDPAFTNVGVQVDSSPDLLVHGNSFRRTQIGLLVNNGLVAGGAVLTCNSVSDSIVGLRTLSYPTLGTEVSASIYHNAFSNLSVDINNGWTTPNTLVVGSNYYAGNAPNVAGTASLVADSLSATPIGENDCGDNSPVQIVAYAGAPQSTLVSTAFASTLDARVVDALGGAVMGESVSFAAPASGASATLGPVSGLTNFNGVVSISATANNLAGSYAVTASSGGLTPEASFALTNDPIIGTVSWDDLSFVYDGNTHTATAHITEEPATICTVTPVFGPNVGNYAVTATCSGTTYAASDTNTASITPRSATLALSNLTQAFDGSPKPATVTSTPSGVLYSVTYNGNATAPSAIGDYAVVATITDPNHTGPQTSDVLHIVEADAPDLGISITDNRQFVQFGKLLTYTIVVNNPGNTNMTGATVTSNLPVTLLNATPSWQCVQVSPGASCTPSGTGNLSDTAVNIPAGGGVVYLFNAWVKDDASLPTDVISTTATVSAAGDIQPTNDSATDNTQAVLLRDGFEVGGDGAEDVDAISSPDQVNPLTADNLQMLDLGTAWNADGRIAELARVQGDAGKVIRIQTLRTSGQLLVRLLGSNAVSEWTTINAGTRQLAVGLSDQSVLLVGATADLQLAIDSTSAQISTMSHAQQ